MAEKKQEISVGGAGVQCQHNAGVYLAPGHRSQQCPANIPEGERFCPAHTGAVYRGGFQEYPRPPAWVTTLVVKAERIGVYTTGIESVRRSRGPRGTSVNVDVYGWDEAQGVAVVQVRECQFRAGRYNRVRKD